MADLNGFNANEVEPTVDLEPIPAGKHVAVIIDSVMKTTKKGTGKYLEFTFQVIEGEYKNRLLWARFNLENPSPVAVKIARAKLSTICKAVGVIIPGDTVKLHNLPLEINVRCKKRDDTGEMINEIKGYAEKPSAPPGNNSTAHPWSRT